MANLTRYDPLGLAAWDPFGTSDMMNDMFRDFMRPTRGMQGMGQNQMMPFRMDVNETDNAYIVHADLPGVRKEDIHVSIEGSQVTIDAEARAPEMGGMQGQGMSGMQGQGGMQGQNVPIEGQGGAGTQGTGQSGTTGKQGSQATSGQQAGQSMSGQQGGQSMSGQQGGQAMSGQPGSHMMASQGGQMQRQGMRSLRTERYTGRIYRSFILPEEVDADKAKAKFENGVLTLTLPKMQHAAGRQLNIE